MKVQFGEETIDIEGNVYVSELLNSLSIDYDHYIVIENGKIANLNTFLKDDSEVLLLKAAVGG
ncbi:MAG: MoaD/ThiS family protein [Kosmotogaceae bacterium]|nr:MoaD/ThiS family protein [Kosmotogaceae bacterium]